MKALVRMDVRMKTLGAHENSVLRQDGAVQRLPLQVFTIFHCH
jgi:hypothetical protein